jgi:uncharacterized protein (DUF305 family)
VYLSRLACTVLVIALVSAACAPAATPAGGTDTFDRPFIDMMVPHHEGAIEMAKIAQQRAERSEIRQMAMEIIRAQNAEIMRMKAWRKAWFGSDETPPMSRMPMVPGMAGAHGQHGETMDMAADVEALRNASAPFDRAFIDAMILHHESAIAAARAAETRAQRSEIKELAKAIIAEQQHEIDQMRQWRQAWFGSATPAR